MIHLNFLKIILIFSCTFFTISLSGCANKSSNPNIDFKNKHLPFYNQKYIEKSNNSKVSKDFKQSSQSDNENDDTNADEEDEDTEDNEYKVEEYNKNTTEKSDDSDLKSNFQLTALEKGNSINSQEIELLKFEISALKSEILNLKKTLFSISNISKSLSKPDHKHLDNRFLQHFYNNINNYGEYNKKSNTSVDYNSNSTTIYDINHLLIKKDSKSTTELDYISQRY